MSNRLSIPLPIEMQYPINFLKEVKHADWYTKNIVTRDHCSAL